MKKILIGLLLVILALWGGMTWVAANKTEATFNNMLAQSNQRISEAAPFLTMEKQSFSKGFISSKAKSIVIVEPEIFDGKEPLKIVFDHTIYHGPFMLTADGIKLGTSYIITTLDQSPLEEKVKQTISLVFAGAEPFTSRTQTHFNNNITEFIDIPSLTLDSVTLESIFGSGQNSNNNFKLSLAGISGEFNTDPEATFLQGWLATEALEITGNDTHDNYSINVDSSVTEFDIDELYHGAMLLGSATFKLPQMLISDDKKNITLNDIVVKSSADEQSEYYNQLATIDIAKLLVNTGYSTSLFPESKLHMAFGLNGIDQSSTKRLIDLSQSLNQAQLAQLKSQNSSQAQQQLEANLNNYLQALSELIKPGLTSNNLIELSNDKGSSSIHFDLSYVSATKLLDLKTLKELILALSADLRLNIDKKMVEGFAIEQLINSPMANNTIKSNLNAYTAIATLNAGQMNLNGEPIPLLEMLGPTADEPLHWEEFLQ